MIKFKTFRYFENVKKICILLMHVISSTKLQLDQVPRSSRLIFTVKPFRRNCLELKTKHTIYNNHLTHTSQNLSH